MQRDPNKYLWDAQTAATAIQQFTSGKTSEEFGSDLLLRSAVERQFEIIGEALAQMAKLDLELARKIPNLGDRD
jgi:uncharacterized protein with HEPN domain